MKVYTKTGDGGTTSRFGGKRVSKASLEIEVAGQLDELTSFIGLVATYLENKKEVELLQSIQHDLYKIMALVAGSKEPVEEFSGRAKEFERIIDVYTSQLPELHSFIMPGGTPLSGWFHILRAVTRRAERSLISLVNEQKENRLLQGPAPYLNRLSDLFFTMARIYNREHELKLKRV
jgi:cob(I)alamin adenosyltransferase